MMSIVALAFLSVAVAGPSASVPSKWASHSTLLAFGDSYTFVQGQLGYPGFSFIGSAQNFSYTPSQLLSNEIIGGQNGTSAGGPNWVENLTGCFEGLPTSSSCQRQLWDFAFAGADVSPQFTALHHDYSIDLVDQIRQFTTYGASVLPSPKNTTLVTVWIGINDISDTASWKNITSFPNFYNEIISTMFSSVEGLYNAGYRDFLLMNLPPLEKTPSGQAAGAKALPNATMVGEWNSALKNQTTQFQASHKGSTALVFDAYTTLTNIFENAEEYGITNTTSFCPNYNAPDIETNYAAYGCIPIDQYFWYNSGHITYRVHEILASAVGSFIGWT